MRDLFLTARSFVKRLTAFLRYRRATQDMNRRYEDASVEDIAREDTCIICRETMRPWSVTNPQVAEAAPGQAPPPRRSTTVNERSRPKKLPCGHILHLGCLKSWLERQQVCPTCRRPVVETAAQAVAARAGQGAQVPGAQVNQAAGNQDLGPPPPGPPGGPLRGMRMLNIGPLRVGFGQAPLQDIAQGFAGRPDGQQNNGPGPRVYGFELGFPRRAQPPPQEQQGQQQSVTASGSQNVREQLQALEEQIIQEIHNLQVAQSELTLVRTLQAELARLRMTQNSGRDPNNVAYRQVPLIPQPPNLAAMPPAPQPPFNRGEVALPMQVPMVQRHSPRPNTTAIPSGSPDLPPGVILPEGWSLLPLQRVDLSTSGLTPGVTVQPPNSVNTTGQGSTTPAPTPTSQPGAIPLNHESSNNNTTPTTFPRSVPISETTPSSSQADLSATNASRPQPSATADQRQSAPSPSNTTTNSVSNPTSAKEEVEAPEPIAPTPTTTSQTSLPNWGSSQLFAGANLRGNGTGNGSSSYSRNDSGMTTMPQSNENGRARGKHPATNSLSAHGASDESESDSASESDDDEDEAQRSIVDKGKGRAATVEDVKDEDEDEDEDDSDE